jgi:integrase
VGRRANGEGSIWRRQDGRWVGSAYARISGGGRKRVHIYARTRAEAREKLTMLQRDVDRGVTMPAQSWALGDYLQHWLTTVVRPNRMPKTYQGYELAVRNHIVPVLGRKRLSRLSVTDVRTFVEILNEKGLGARMVQYVHAVLRNALESALRDELVARNVAKLVKVKTPTYDVGRGLTIEQARRLLQAARGDRLQSLYVLAVYLGLRRAEVLGLRWLDVDLEAETLQVAQTLQRVEGELRFLPPKTKHSKRTVPLPANCVEALRSHRVAQDRERLARGGDWSDHGLVITTSIGTPIEPDNLRRSWYKLRESAGQPSLRFHDLRHTCVSLLLDDGAPPHVVREIVGHSAIDVTMTIYAHASLQEKRKALEALGSRLA